VKRILIVSFTSIFGGGETFIINILSKVTENLYYLVACEQLYKTLESNNKYLLMERVFTKRIKVIKDLIRNKHIDIVVLNGGSALYAAPFLNHVRKVSIRHTLNAYYSYSYFFILLHIAYFASDRVIHVSNISKKEQLLFRNKAVVIYNGVKIKEKHIVHNDIMKFLFIGRLDRSKGVDVLIQAFKKLTGSDVHLTIIGTGDLYSDGYFDNITFKGFQMELEQYYMAADYFISLPDFENCPFATLDALSYGVPVISTEVGGVKEIIQNGYNGFFVRKNAESVVSLIQKLLNDNNEYLRENARNTIKEKFNLDDKITEYKRIIGKL
jgi:glycosyltransferase involved in cell wall biosynthesis